MTLPSGVKLNSLPVKIGYYDRASGWKHIGDLTLVGSTATFTPSGTTNITLNAGVKYYAITYTCGAPNIYIANALGTDFKITLYDENGNQLSTLGRFLNLYAPIAIAFDSYNQHFYVADEDSSAFIKVYDRNGNQLTTSGTFQNLRSPVNGMAFDSSNRHLYVVSYSAGPVITIYDENGNQIIPSGAFPNIDNPIAIAFDSSNNYLYVTDNNDFRHATIRVYDQNGNQISTSGTFPNLTPQLVDIAFDSSNNHLYVVHYQESRSGVNPDAPDSITEYDQDGNQVPTSGSFPNLNGPTGVAFDPTNNHLYVTNIFGAVKIIVYDENGNQITTSGTFQGLHAPAALTAVP